MKNTLKTVGGIVVIAAIIVGTFLYGNYQRERQLAANQTPQPNGATESPAATATPASTPTPTATPAATATPKPATPTPTMTATPRPSATPTPVVASAATPTPQAGAGTSMPETGPEAAGVLALGSLSLAGVWYRTSRNRLKSALRRS